MEWGGAGWGGARCPNRSTDSRNVIVEISIGGAAGFDQESFDDNV